MIYYRHRLCGFIGRKYKEITTTLEEVKFYQVYWFTNRNHKNLFTGKNIPNISAWTSESDIIKKYHKLPRKLKKKLKVYLNL